METFKSLAFKILKDSDVPLHSKEITKRAKERGLVTEGITPEATMYAQLIVDINSNGNDSLFKKVGPSTFTINDRKSVTAKVESQRIYLPNMQLSSKQKGDIAESRIAELIMLYGKKPGFSCYKPISDDEGIDLIVKKRGEFKTMFVQVKSRFGIKENLVFTSTVKRKTVLENYSMGLVFCYFDLTKGDIWDYLWFVPAPDFMKKSNKLNGGESLGFVAGKKQKESNKWDEYMIDKQGLAKKIQEQMQKI